MEKTVPETKPIEPGAPGAEPPGRLEMVHMLLRYLPDEGLTNDQLVRWLRAAEVNLRMAYDTPGAITIAEQDK